MRIVVSSEAEARYTLSNDQAMSESPCVCPDRFLKNSPVSGDQIFTTFSAPQEANNFPSGLNLTAEMDIV